MNLIDKIYSKIALLPKFEHIRWEILSLDHSGKIVKWRNAPENKQFFENQEQITLEEQCNFIKKYDTYDRFDLVLLYDATPIGVFNIKNLNSFPEYGALIGDERYRNKGLGSLAKSIILKFWFDILSQNELYFKNRKNNKNVIASNLKKGYTIFEEDEQYITFRVDKVSYFKHITQ